MKNLFHLESFYTALCSLAQRKQLLSAQLKGQRFKSPFSCMDRIVYQDGMNYEPCQLNRGFSICDIKVYSERSRQLTMHRFVFGGTQNLN